MILILSTKEDASTDNVLNWIFVKKPQIKVKRINDNAEIKSIHYSTSNDEEKVKVKTNLNVKFKLLKIE